MLPSLLLIGIGERRRIWIPLPMLLLWPFWILGWGAWLVLYIIRVPWERPLKVFLMLGTRLSGLRVDVDSVKGEHVHIRMI